MALHVVAGRAWDDTGSDNQYRFHLARFTTSGAADTSFSGDGIVLTAFMSGAYEHAFDLGLLGDGRIVAVGHTGTVGSNNFLIARYKADGSLDSSYGGGNGAASQDLGGDDIAYAVAMTPGGGMVVAGTSGNNFAVARFGTQRLYAQQDANFNVTSITDAAGTVQERYLYDPYGAVTYKTGSWGSRSSSSFSWVYLHQGGRYDGSSKLYHFRNREYSTTLGRWTSADPLQYVDGASLYLYQRGAPTIYVDPSGMAPPPDWTKKLPSTPGLVQMPWDSRGADDFLDAMNEAYNRAAYHWDQLQCVRGWERQYGVDLSALESIHNRSNQYWDSQYRRYRREYDRRSSAITNFANNAMWAVILGKLGGPSQASPTRGRSASPTVPYVRPVTSPARNCLPSR